MKMVASVETQPNFIQKVVML